MTATGAGTGTATGTATQTAMGRTPATTAAARATRHRNWSGSFGDSARLGLTPYFLLLALPLAIGVWAFGNFSAANTRQRVDSQLRSSLDAAVARFGADVT